MPTITRRAMMKTAVASSVGFGSPMFASDGPAEPEVVNTPATISPNPNLLYYVSDKLMTTATKVHRGTASKSDLTEAASHMRLLATHLSDAGFDIAVGSSLPPPVAMSASMSSLPSFDQHVDFAKRYDPSLAAIIASSSPVNLTADYVSKLYADIKRAGVSGFINEAADHVHKASTNPKILRLDSFQVDKPHLEDEVYMPVLSQRAHLENVQCTNPGNGANTSKPSFCTEAGLAWGALSAAVGAVLNDCESSTPSFAFCSSLAAEVTILGLSYTATGWIGLGILVISVLLLIICS